jgi:GT2 family glycosyltransferase
MSPPLQVDLTVIIVNYNTGALLQPCVAALRAGAAKLQLQIVIVDNASRDDSVEILRRDFADCDLIFNSVNVGFGRANNQALAHARGRHLLLLNTDAFVAPDSVLETVRYLDEHTSCALVGVRLAGRDGEPQPSCRSFPTPWNEFVARTGLRRFFPGTTMVDDMSSDHTSPRECDWVTGCFYLVRKCVVDQVGLFDPRFFLYYEEVDHCFAVKSAGWQVVYYPGTTVVHLGGESAKSEGQAMSAGQISALQIESSLLYHRKHHGRAGMWLNMGLVTLADALLALRWLVRQRSLRGAMPLWTHLSTSWSLLLKTDWATRPTR